MSFKEFLVKNVMNSFLISVPFICIGMAIVGSNFEPENAFPTRVFWHPYFSGWQRRFRRW